MLRLFILGVVFSYGRGDVVDIRYPTNNPCMLIDIDAEFQLVWTDVNGTKNPISSFELNNENNQGVCAYEFPEPQVLLFFADNEGYFFLSFTNQNDIISYNWNMRYPPRYVYTNNNQKVIVRNSGNFGTGSSTKAFACDHVPVVNDTQTYPDMNEYHLTITIKSIKAQAFNVMDGKFSEEDRCSADLISTRPTTIRSSAKRTTAITKPTHVTTKPTTGTTRPSTVPTPSPTPVPAPNAHAKQTFEVYAEDRQCVLMQGEFLFTLVYPKNDKTNGSVDVGVQKIKSITGDCNATGGSKNVITVNFYDNWKMDLTISKKTSSVVLAAEADSETKYYWSHLNLSYNYKTTLGGKPLFSDVLAYNTAPEMSVNLADGTYEASSDGSYLCKSNQNLDLMGGNKLHTWNLQYDAFRTTNHTTFTDKNLTGCSAESKTNIVVPIAVSAAIAGLVVIVLITYSIFRRRNRKGYESVLMKTTDFGIITEYCYNST